MRSSIKGALSTKVALRMPEPSLRYVASLCDNVGMFEHAEFAKARPEHGYCVDDVGRLLDSAVLLRDDPRARYLAELALGYLERAQRGNRFANRCSTSGVW